MSPRPTLTAPPAGRGGAARAPDARVTYLGLETRRAPRQFDAALMPGDDGSEAALRDELVLGRARSAMVGGDRAAATRSPMTCTSARTP